MKSKNVKSGYSVIKLQFLNGETSYHLNQILNHGSQGEAMVKAAKRRIELDIRDGKTLNRIQQFIIGDEIASAEVIQIFDDINLAKQLVNLQMELDEKCIRRRKFKV